MSRRAPTPQPGTTTAVPPADLHLFHRNPRRGDVDAIAHSLIAHKQYKPIVVNVGTYTGRPCEVLAGNHTLLAFRHMAEISPADPQWQKILVHWVGVDDDMAARIVVADNRTSELGSFDNEELLALLDGFGDNLDGIGFTVDDITELQRLVDAAPDFDDELGGRGTGEKIALWGSTVGEPDITPESGSVWQVGHHKLVVCSVHRQWDLWAPHSRPRMHEIPRSPRRRHPHHHFGGRRNAIGPRTPHHPRSPQPYRLTSAFIRNYLHRVG